MNKIWRIVLMYDNSCYECGGDEERIHFYVKNNKKPKESDLVNFINREHDEIEGFGEYFSPTFPLEYNQTERYNYYMFQDKYSEQYWFKIEEVEPMKEWKNE